MLLKNLVRKFLNRLLKIKIFFLKTFKLSRIYQTTFTDLLDPKQQQSLEIVIFSKDRPLQLLALLESLEHFSHPKILPHIIYNAKNAEYQNAYNELFAKHAHLFKSKYNDKENGFKKTLMDLLESFTSDKITFFVDDIILKTDIHWSSVLCFNSAKVIPALRLAPHLTFCYTASDQQTLPPLIQRESTYWWFWKDGDYDWRYPLSVDGNIFSRTEILQLTKDLEFKAPNTLEWRLQKHAHLFLNRLGMCFPESVIVNNPINKVQSEINNIHGKVHQDELLEIWNQNKKIDFLKFKNLKNISAHQELEFSYIPEAL